MGYEIQVSVDGATTRVDGRDVAAWRGRSRPLDDSEDGAREMASEYVAAHPRAQRVANAQRMAVLRRLAAGPASRADLLAAMRAAGWVGADDLENRLRDLRSSDARAGGSPSGVALASEGEQYWLTEPFPWLEESDERALGFAKAMLEQLQGVLPRRAEAALHHLVPGIGPGGRETASTRYRASLADYARFYTAYAERRPVRVTYHSYNSDRVGTYDVVPVEYVTLTPSVKAMCVEVTRSGQRAGDDRAVDRQLALDRIRSVETLPEWADPDAGVLVLDRTPIEMTVSDSLYRVIIDRNLLGVDEGTEYVQDPHDQSWRVAGSFPTALSWDVMEQLCAWSGQVQVHEPLWLVNAVLRRLRAGMRVMEEGGAFTLVKPEPLRRFADHRDAVSTEAPLPPRTGPRRLEPRE